MKEDGAGSLVQEAGLLAWICLSVWYYGYHISELNTPQPSLTCSSARSETPSALLGLPNCLDISPFLYSLATAIFTVGGLVGSAASAAIVSRCGMIASVKLTGWTSVVASATMLLAPHWIVLVTGRFVGGLAAGLGITLVSPLLNTIAKTSAHPWLSSHSGAIGILNQIAITIGIVCGQAAALALTGLKGTKEGQWRWVVAVSGVVATFQIITGLSVPNDIVDRRRSEERSSKRTDEAEEDGPAHPDDQYVEARERDEEPAESSPLVGIASSPQEPLAVSSLFSSPTLRPAILLIAWILATQQLSGINAILNYSASILQRLLPAGAGVISLGISAVNLIMTFPAVLLIDRVGRKPLLLTSMALMAIFSTLVGIGLNKDLSKLTGACIVLATASFALGLGSIPFLLLPEIMPAHAVPAASAIALSVSWLSNFVVTLGFLPLRDAMSGDGSGERGQGNVFAVFVSILVISGMVIQRYLYRN